jgi:hypothetical protein
VTVALVAVGAVGCDDSGSSTPADGGPADGRPSSDLSGRDQGADARLDARAPDASDLGASGPVEDCGFQGLTGEHVEIMRFVSADEQTQALIVREGQRFRPVTDFTLKAFAVRHGGRLHCVDAPSRLSYLSTHHNWLDEAETTIDGVTYNLEMRYQPTGDAWPPDGPLVWTYRLRGLDSADELLWGPIDLACEDLHGLGCSGH